MKKLFLLLTAVTILACPFVNSLAADGSTQGDTACPHAAAERQGAGVAPLPQADGAPGRWVEVPGESVGGRWVPPHAVWVPSNPPAVAGQAGDVQYGPPPGYVVVPSPPPDFASILADLFVMRPLGIAALAIGTGATIVATPFAIPSGSMGEVSRNLIVKPYDFTFRRPLGVW